ncbi:hypothetical protein PV325_000885 [Microctonus aethiopoides]|nr:hypothetical protein PV325_000885 [Microctonus aethiopoides]
MFSVTTLETTTNSTLVIEECTDNANCTIYEKCLFSQCVDACTRVNNGDLEFCNSINSYCTLRDHDGTCKCAGYYEGDPYKGCTKQKANIPSEDFMSGN